MAEPSEGAPLPEDAYDLGDTSLTSQGTISPPKASPKTPPGERPRGPDGKFLALNKPAESVASNEATNVEPPPPAPKHPPQLVAQLEDYGYSAEDIEGMSPVLAYKTAHAHGQQRLRFQNEQLRARQVTEGQVRTPQPEPKEEEIDLDFGVGEDGRPLTEQDFHPGLVRALKGMTKKQLTENKLLREELAKRDERENARELNRAAAVFDAAFAALGPEYELVVGKGPGREMTQANQDEYDNRIAILTRAQADPRQHTVAQVKARVKAAAEKMFGKFIGKNPAPYAEVQKPGQVRLTNGAAPVKPRISQEDWEEGALARPTQRVMQDMPNGEEKAVRNLASKMDQEVIPDSEELDGFPE